jgi:hypothetical protein
VSQNCSCSLVRPDDRSLGGGGETLEGAMVACSVCYIEVELSVPSTTDGVFCGGEYM